LFILSFVTRSYFLVIPHHGWDEVIYFSLVSNLDERGVTHYTLSDYPLEVPRSYVGIKVPLFFHPPLFPYILLCLSKLVGATFAAFLVNSISTLFVALLVYKVSFLITGNRRIGICMSLISISEPVLWLSSFKVWMEELICFLSLAYLYGYLLALQSKKLRHIFLCGIAGGALLETKLYSFLLVLPIALHFLWLSRQDKIFLVAPAVSLMLFAPWIYWNVIVYDGNLPFEALRYSVEFVPRIYKPFASPFAYIVFLPMVSPVTFIGYLGLIKKSRPSLPHFTLVAVFLLVLVVLSLFSATRELRYASLILPLYFMFGMKFLGNKRDSLVYATSFFIVIYNVSMVFSNLMLLNFSYAPDVIFHPLAFL
jgi:4-amino-4-deoxy-L-arabinose transferase-like glycosyltransferase